MQKRFETPESGLQKAGRECFNQVIETGVLHNVGLRNTLEPDPDNTGVGSFRSQAAYFLESQREFSCFMVGDKGHHVRYRALSHRFKGP